MLAPEDLTIEQYAEDLRACIGATYRNEWSRSMFGPKMPPPYTAFNTAAHGDFINKFVDATGDLNLLFRDGVYAAATRYGVRLAPPTFLYSIAYGHYPNPLNYAPPSHFYGLYGGDDYEWFDVLREGDEFDWVTTLPADIQIKATRSVGDMLFIYGTHDFYRRSDGRLVGRCRFWVGHFASRTGTIAGRDPIRHTPDFVQTVYDAQDAEIVRGADPRYWEDVAIGDKLQPVVRGPYTAMENTAWRVGGIGERYYISDRLGRYIHETTGWGYWDPNLSIWKNFHDTGDDANGAGSQRSAWVGVMLTNWAGDEGFVRRMRTEQRGRGQFGNVYYAEGEVTEKRREGPLALVDVACRVINHKRESMLIGTATIALPTREAPVPLPLEAGPRVP